MTATADKLAARAEDLPEGSVRRKVLEGAQRFKSAWVELGRLLSEVRRKELWRGWGYPSFERYCTKELFIRSATAEKLTASYGFLERHEPELARARGETRAPPFEVIEVLSRAEATGRLSDSGWRELRDEVIERPPTPAAMNRKIAERFGPPPAPPAPPRSERVERLAAAARRLASACRDEDAIPRSVAQRADALAGEIEALLDR
ncbi:hypothetical protein [Anaeromyxobacter dehalogenans]|uniref:DUF3102 domain-containing protein n=1 Tax=Anaeromyxobacter dehalogenans (strain 2CP-C) TaxID=290397 RepID=Q2II37_ANADE|nr:hypothetical protein [Anaeromyxobacter dehalogenans]ABC81319.1 conserved hypothetical protein [Anaeromyxobacter dehalogenans 2CP-C]